MQIRRVHHVFPSLTKNRELLEASRFFIGDDTGLLKGRAKLLSLRRLLRLSVTRDSQIQLFLCP